MSRETGGAGGKGWLEGRFFRREKYQETRIIPGRRPVGQAVHKGLKSAGIILLALDYAAPLAPLLCSAAVCLCVFVCWGECSSNTGIIPLADVLQSYIGLHV